MSTDKEKLDQIEHYLQDQLSDQEKKDRDKLLKEDPDFRTAFGEYQLLIEGVKYTGRNELLNKFKEIEKKNFSQESPREQKNNLRKYYLGLAASLGLLLLSYVGVQEFYFNTPERVAANYFEPYPALIGGATRSAEAGEKTDFENATALFESGNYEEAIELYSRISSSEYEELAEFYLANAHHSLKNYSEAIHIYKEIIAEGGLLKDQAEWYLALAYLATEQTTQASDLLVSIKNSGNDYADKADKVLNSVK